MYDFHGQIERAALSLLLTYDNYEFEIKIDAFHHEIPRESFSPKVISIADNVYM